MSSRSRAMICLTVLAGAMCLADVASAGPRRWAAGYQGWGRWRRGWDGPRGWARYNRRWGAYDGYYGGRRYRWGGYGSRRAFVLATRYGYAGGAGSGYGGYGSGYGGVSYGAAGGCGDGGYGSASGSDSGYCQYSSGAGNCGVSSDCPAETSPESQSAGTYSTNSVARAAASRSFPDYGSSSAALGYRPASYCSFGYGDRGGQSKTRSAPALPEGPIAVAAQSG